MRQVLSRTLFFDDKFYDQFYDKFYPVVPVPRLRGRRCGGGAPRLFTFLRIRPDSAVLRSPLLRTPLHSSLLTPPTSAPLLPLLSVLGQTHSHVLESQ